MTTYKSAGVNIDTANQTVKKIKKYAEATYSSQILTKLGLFGGAFDLEKILKEFKEPILIQSIDGVGTKIEIAKMMNKFETIGQDLINHSANDILTLGARPLTFLDYIACKKLKPEIATEIVKGLAAACQEINCALIGGETAEMPGVYNQNAYDLAGCITGVVEKSKIINGSKIQKGDLLLGLASSGLHTNGYSLARKIFFQNNNFKIDKYFPKLKTTLGKELLKIHRSYFKIVYPLLDQFEIHGISHITGGGLEENTNRLLKNGLKLKIDYKSWPRLPIFNFIQKLGQVSEEEMRRTFNLGIGLVLIAPEKQLNGLKKKLEARGKKIFLIGKVT